MKKIIIACLLPLLILILSVTPVFGTSQMEISGVYEMKAAPGDFSQKWDNNAYGIKMRFATRGDWKNNLGLTFCHCQYSAQAVTPTFPGDLTLGLPLRKDLTAFSLGISQKSTFGKIDDLIHPYVKGEFGVAQMSTGNIQKKTHGYIGLGLGLSLNLNTDFRFFLESGFVLGLNNGIHDKMIPLHLGIAINR